MGARAIASLLVTAGPSGHRLAELGLPIEVVDPISAGQLVTYADSGARNILILDGYFERQLALTIAEIRSVVASGVVVLGGTSLGALRAAEASTVGMIGVGSIYRQLRSGRLVDDSDLALTFLPDFSPLSIPQVNVWYLCKKLEALGARRSACDWLYAQSGKLHFPDRTLRRLATIAEELGGHDRHVTHTMLQPECYKLWDFKSIDACVSANEAIAILAGTATPIHSGGPIPKRYDRLISRERAR